MPCHSSTSKSASKSSVSVYQGISQPIRAFQRSMSACGARETYAKRGVAGVQVSEVRDLVGHERAAAAAALGPAVRRRARRRSGRRSAGGAPRTGRAGSTGPSGPSKRYSFSTAIRGIRRRSAASASRARVSSFSLTSSSSRAASHSCGDTIGGMFISAPPPSGTHRRHRTGAPRGRAGDPSTRPPRSSALGSSESRCVRPSTTRVTTPVSSSTFRCLEIAGLDTPKPAGRFADRRRTCGEAFDDAAADRM